MKKILGFLTSKMFFFFAIIALQVWLSIAFLNDLLELHPAIRVIVTCASVVFVFYLINKKQDPTYKLVWIAAVCLFPLVGIVLYFFFSQKRMGRKLRRELLTCENDCLRYLAQEGKICMEVSQTGKGFSRLSEYIRETRYYPLYSNTQTEYFGTGELFFERLMIELKKAKRYIFMEFFIVEKGYMYDAIFEVLRQKAAEGLDVRFMYDDIGCMNLLPPFHKKELEKQGIKCVEFNPLRPVLHSMFNNRDHRKIIVIDGHTSFVCGSNLADEYINKIQKFGVWKDACLMMKGDATWGFLIMFIQLWDSCRKETTDVEALRPLAAEMELVESSGYVQPFDDSPLHDIDVCERVLLTIIGGARDYLYVNTPYLVPNDSLMNALTSAAISGVDVRITVPHIPDKKAVFNVTCSNYKRLLESGVRIYEYTPGFMHSKTVVSDDDLAMVGTINLDYRSLFLHFECAALIYKTNTVRDVKADFLQTIQLCQEISSEEVNNWPWYVRFIQMVCRVFAPLF